MDCSPPGFSLHGILQARILEWVAISFSRGSSRPRDQSWVSHIAGRCFNLWATREAHRVGLWVERLSMHAYISYGARNLTYITPNPYNTRRRQIFLLQLVRGLWPIEVKCLLSIHMVRKCWDKDLNPKLSLSSLLTFSKPFQSAAYHLWDFWHMCTIFARYSLIWLSFLWIECKCKLHFTFTNEIDVFTNYPNSH